MMSKWKKKTIGLAAAALILTVSAAAGRAMAYFTTYVTASGGYVLDLGFTTTIPNEKVSDWKKEITITNTGQYPCYVRVKAFAGSKYALEYDLTNSDSRWSARGTEPNVYYYWHDVLEPGASTGSLLVKIDHTKAEDDFNVIIVQECTPVPYDENGNRKPWDQVDWSRTADVVKTETTEHAGSREDQE